MTPSAGLAQTPEQVAPLGAAVTSVLVRTPTSRNAPEISAEFIQLPATSRLGSDAGFNVAGYVQPAPPELLADAEWQVAADGRAVLAVELFSEDAESLRVRFDPGFDERVGLYVYDPATGAAFGPYSKHQLVMTEWWSTIIFGDSIGLEFVVEGDGNPPVTPTIASIAYGTVAPTPPGVSQGCMHRDASCEPDWATTADSVALLATLNQNGNLSTFCTGALLNRGPGDRSPLVMTANHCVGSQGEAGPTVFVWFFETDSCNGNMPDPNTLPRSEGSLLLKRFTDADWTLLGLYEPPSTGRYLGWSSGYWDDDTPATGIHHPRGGFKRISFGTKVDESNQEFCDQNENCFDAEVWDVDYTTGFTEPGSSGSPVMSSVGIMRGTLTGGIRCSTSRYGRFDLAYENLRYFLSSTYIASPVYVNRNVGGDSGNNGNSERGTSAQPFNTVYEAAFAVRAGDRVLITPGTYDQRMTIWRPMRLERSGASGTVRIGG
jgi:hypothetical protein